MRPEKSQTAPFFFIPRSFALTAISLLMSTMVMAVLTTRSAHAQEDAVWSMTPSAGGSFNDPGNWSTSVVPTGIAFFGPTDGRSPLILENTTLNQFQFLPDAPSYSIGDIGPSTLTFVDGGVTLNLSNNNQIIVVTSTGTLTFDNSTAGNNTIGYSNRGE